MPILPCLSPVGAKPLTAAFDAVRRVSVKVAVRVEELKGKIRLAFPASYPQATFLALMTGTLTARGP
jgi:hypothetical protein